MPEIEKSKVPFYRDTAEAARERGEIEKYRESYWENKRCVSELDAAISRHHDGTHLDTDAVINEITAAFGMERTAFVLAAHIADHEWDKRFHSKVMDWAKSELALYPEGMSRKEENRITLNSHSVLIDGVASKFMDIQRVINQQLSSPDVPESGDIPEKLTNKERVKAITEKLEQGVKAVFASGRFAEYLRAMSKFHAYSMNNTLLILMQKPDASLVKGFQAWKKDFERSVNKGEKGIEILAPMFFKKEEEQQKRDPITDEPIFDKDGKPVMEKVEVRLPYFKPVYVFDVSQTSGKEIPSIGGAELQGEVEDFEKLFQTLREISPFPISFTNIEDGAKGVCRFDSKTIEINEGMSEVQTIKTALHEIAHSILHDRDVNAPDSNYTKDANTEEVEAESVAFTVAQYLGIDTSDYYFDYVTAWSSGKEVPELKSSLETIQETASKLITEISSKMLGKEQTQEQKAEKAERSDLIGNTPYKDIPDKQYMRVDTDIAEQIVGKLNERDIHFSGKINGDKTTFTINKSDMDAFKAIEKEVKAAAKEERSQPEETEKKRFDIIGNTEYKTISDKKFVKLPTEVVPDITAKIEAAGIKYSGRINGDSTTLTVSKADLKAVNDIINDNSVQRPAPEKDENKRSDIIGNTPFKEIPDKEYTKLPTEQAQKVAAMLEEQGVKFSGRIAGELTTLTISRSDLGKVKAAMAATEPKLPCQLYIIPDMKTWKQNAPNRTPIERFDSFAAAKARFMELRRQDYNLEHSHQNDGEPYARLTLGIEGRFGAYDIIHIRDDRNVLITDFTRDEEQLLDKPIFDVIGRISEEIGFDTVLEHPMLKEGVYGFKGVEIPFAEWDKKDNKYFGKGADEQTAPAPEKSEAPTAGKPVPEKGKEPDIIGNIAYNDIPDKKYIKVPTDKLPEINAALESSFIKYSGRIKEDSTTLTVSGEDAAKVRSIVSGIIGEKEQTAEKTATSETPAKNADKGIIGNTPFKEIPNKNYIKLTAEKVEIVASILDEKGIKFSGRINGEKATLTLSKADIPACKKIIEGLGKVEQTAEKIIPPLYRESAKYAMENGESSKFVESNRLNRLCLTEMRLDGEIAEISGKLGQFAEKLAEKYGADRVMYVAAQTINRVENGHFSPEARTIALRSEFYDGDNTLLSDIKPSVLDGIIVRLDDMQRGTVGITENQHGLEVAHEKQEYTGKLPDEKITIEDRNAYGYTDNAMLPITTETALEMFDNEAFSVYLLYPDGTEGQAVEREDIEQHSGIFGIETADWERYQAYSEQMDSVEQQQEAREAMLLNPNNCMIGIYQIRDDAPDARNLRFEPMSSLEKQGKIPDRDNYTLVYTMEVAPEKMADKDALLEAVFEQFNIERPADFYGHSLSVSDIVVVQNHGELSANYVDRSGFKELDSFGRIKESPIKAVEDIVEQNDNNFDGIINNTPPAPTMQEIEEKVKNGEQVSLMDIAAAVHSEKNEPEKKSPKKKPSVLGRIKQEKAKSEQKQCEDKEKKPQDKTTPKKKGEVL